MDTKLLLFKSVLLSSCTAIKPKGVLIGKYFSQGKDYSYSLKLNRDCTFQFTQNYIDAKSSCEGNRRTVSGDSILLQCFPPEFPDQLEGGYMSQRERKVAIINSRKLKIDNVELKFVKESEL